MFCRRLSKAQSTLEYAVLIAAVVGALIAMQIYFKRSVAGKLRQSTDDIAEQFEIKKTKVVRQTNVTQSKTVQEVAGGATTTYTGGSPIATETKGLSEIRTEKIDETVSTTE